jgi:spermidine/putrescine transport system ATP-binding protein
MNEERRPSGDGQRDRGGGNVQLVDLVKRFDDVVAVAGISLDIPPGQFFSLLGPSGCGKTTTLRLIGGFERPDEGRIVLDGQDMAHTPPHRRPVNTVFQSYALFPHLNVFDNVAFGLRFTGSSREEAARRVGEALRLVRLEGFEARKPTQLSGGQQLRVALARALVLNPSVLLLDEPLGSLDAKLRKALQIELKAIQEEVGITFVYVTHDQEEALTMSDRLAVMSEGHIEQVGGPRDVYEEPETAYVADFLGVSNLMDAQAKGRGDGGCRVALGDLEVVAGRGDTDASGPAKLVIRPERVRVEEQGASGPNRLPAMVDRTVYVGSTMQVIVRLPGGEVIQAMIANRGDAHGYPQGTPVTLFLPPEDLRVLQAEGPEAERSEGEEAAPAAPAAT